jgi:hypothetical protein
MHFHLETEFSFQNTEYFQVFDEVAAPLPIPVICIIRSIEKQATAQSVLLVVRNRICFSHLQCLFHNVYKLYKA